MIEHLFYDWKREPSHAHCRNGSARIYSSARILPMIPRSIPTAEATAALVAYATALESRHSELAAQRRAQAPLPWFADALFDHGIALIKAEHAWVTDFIDRVSTESPVSPPNTGGSPMPSTAPARMKAFEPQITTLPARTMAVVRTTGDPAETGARAFPALYGAAYALKFALKKQGITFAVEP